MKPRRRTFFVMAIAMAVVFIMSCRKDDAEEPTPTPTPVPTEPAVEFNLDVVPYINLSSYHFYKGNIALLQPNNRVLPYEPINPLFSDYAHKSRFVWMPEGVSATYNGDNHVFNFPEGTVLIKNFYYDHVQPGDVRRILETRLIYRKDNAWHFADYLWNEEQTEATFSLEGDHVPVDWIDDNGTARSVTFRIPTESECFTCHKISDVTTPIGPKPQNLNSIYNYPDGSKNQLSKWIEAGYLSGTLPADIVTVPSWTDTAQPLDMRVRAYVDANCSHCHQEGSHCSYRPMRFAFSETVQEENLGICVPPEEFINTQLTHVIARGNIERSVMHFRMNTTALQYRMPLLGRTLIHEEAVALVEEYIQSLTPPCQ